MCIRNEVLGTELRVTVLPSFPITRHYDVMVITAAILIPFVRYSNYFLKFEIIFFLSNLNIFELIWNTNCFFFIC